MTNFHANASLLTRTVLNAIGSGHYYFAGLPKRTSKATSSNFLIRQCAHAAFVFKNLTALHFAILPQF